MLQIERIGEAMDCALFLRQGLIFCWEAVSSSLSALGTVPVFGGSSGRSPVLFELLLVPPQALGVSPHMRREGPA